MVVICNNFFFRRNVNLPERQPQNSAGTWGMYIRVARRKRFRNDKEQLGQAKLYHRVSAIGHRSRLEYIGGFRP